MTQEQDIVDRLLEKAAASLSLYRQLYEEAAQTITALRAERDEAQETNRKLHRRVQQAEAPAMSVKDYKQMLWNVFSDRLCQPERADETIEAYKARVKELEIIRDSHSRDTLAALRERDQWKALAKEGADIASGYLKERDEARKALHKYGDHLMHCRYRGGYDCSCGLDDLRRARAASSNREGGE